MDILSTRAVAEMLGVSEATVKRWADAGTLKCFRTPGGHRKFRLRDVKAFLADQNDESPESENTPVSAPSVELTREQAGARALALSSDVDALVSLIATERLRGQSLATILDEVVAPALRELRSAFGQGRLSPAQWQAASGAIKESLGRVRPLVERSSRVDRGRALCASLGDDRHDIALRMMGLILASEGFRTSMVGPHVAAGELALMIAGDPPAVVALSATDDSDIDNLRGDLAVIASAASASRTRIVLGGHGFDRLPSVPSTARRYGKLEELVAATAS